VENFRGSKSSFYSAPARNKWWKRKEDVCAVDAGNLFHDGECVVPQKERIAAAQDVGKNIMN